MSNYIEATMQDPPSQEVNKLVARFKRLNIEDTFQPSRKLGEASASRVKSHLYHVLTLNPRELNMNISRRSQGRQWHGCHFRASHENLVVHIGHLILRSHVLHPNADSVTIWHSS
ncbi:predicted protein [Botrytis cinerea T4]|uniref:Uncharacterized protein n=1 Tax=Botryotinia fuckeliana (strain T4) TaxID=999810 RepID=G2YDV5_BOTF4|nr:predicted protein [Botrytis cinerea T4]